MVFCTDVHTSVSNRRIRNVDDAAAAAAAAADDDDDDKDEYCGPRTNTTKKHRFLFGSRNILFQFILNSASK